MMIDLPPNFDMKNPHKELVYCPCCKKYQHFSFHRPRMLMCCCGCGAKFSFSCMDYKPNWSKPYNQASMLYANKQRQKYGPPKYLMIYNHWKEHPEFTDSEVWKFYYWDIFSYSTYQRYVRCIKKDLEGLEKV